MINILNCNVEHDDQKKLDFDIYPIKDGHDTRLKNKSLL